MESRNLTEVRRTSRSLAQQPREPLRARSARSWKKSWWVLAIGVPAALSLAVHAGLAIAVRYYAWFETSPPRLTDVPVTETQLTFDATPDPALTPDPLPEPLPQAVPEPPAEPVVEQVAQVETLKESDPAPRPEPIAAALDTKPAKPSDLNLAPATRLPALAKTKLSLAPKAVPAPPAAPPPLAPAAPAKATFAGVKADRAERVVYVVDASGAMTTSLTFVMNALARSIGELDESQQFQVILFRDPPPSGGDGSGGSGGGSGASSNGFEIFSPPGARVAGLLRANDTNKDAVRGWLRSVRPLGRSAPLPGLRAALALKPQLVFLLTRSITRSGSTPQWGSGNESVLKTLDELNPHDRVTGRRAVTVKTIQFLDDDPSGLLRSIAEQHGDGPGSYTLRTIGDLQGER